MPNGDIMTNGPLPFVGPFDRTILMLDNAPAPTPGVWVDAHGFNDWSIDVTLLTTGTLNLFGSNEEETPAPSFVGNPITGGNITANGLVAFSNTPARWLRLAVTALTAGTPRAIFYGSTP